MAVEDASEAPPIRARGLVKRYRDLTAVDHIDLRVGPGDVYGFLGPNGAGKTTTLRIALGLITPSEGTIELFGRNPLKVGAAALRGVAGFVEAPRFYPYLTGRKNLELLAGLDGGDAKTRIDRSLETVELLPRGKDRVGGYSHGMRQRLGIAAALLRNPRLLILDEPATGLDPAGMRDMRLLIKRLSGEGITVLLSSHQLPEVQELCDRVAIVNRGRIVYEGALKALRQRAGASHRLRTSDDVAARAVAEQTPGVELPDEQTPRIESFDEASGMTGTDEPPSESGMTNINQPPSESGARGDAEPQPHRQLRVRGSEQAIGQLSLALGAERIAILSLIPELATLEDLFFSLTEDDAQ